MFFIILNLSFAKVVHFSWIDDTKVLKLFDTTKCFGENFQNNFIQENRAKRKTNFWGKEIKFLVDRSIISIILSFYHLSFGCFLG